MKTHRISKSFDFCYGHRVHNQMLNPEYAIDTCLVCRHLHGHQGKVIVSLGSENLESGMVTDFKHLGWFKKFVDDHLDHKMILDIGDLALPELFPRLFEILPGKENPLVHKELIEGIFVQVPAPWIYSHYKNSPAMLDIYEGLIFVDFVPTSENLSKFLYQIISSKMKITGVTIDSVEFQETPKTSAIYG